MDFTSLLLFSGALIFLMIIGPMRKQKKEKNFITQLKRGDRVITKSGLHGKIIEIVESFKDVKNLNDFQRKHLEPTSMLDATKNVVEILDAKYKKLT